MTMVLILVSLNFCWSSLATSQRSNSDLSKRIRLNPFLARSLAKAIPVDSVAAVMITHDPFPYLFSIWCSSGKNCLRTVAPNNSNDDKAKAEKPRADNIVVSLSAITS